ncbi:uncharacterized protein BJ171DRAFT_579244 [Polychytrium aggregatum]|uniref:uncharacterized protein n=1 Tax=Polychytrium aggregatum TaxID=110093 RepID=UPI0022FED87E|nr:uncharacterized protein BJ171DRAFT_579244 [Polychytrium aggregatum]KAI9206885.1 hypothetical protein BJ171DRAFT_579244 [Polychytrium aggregatum]
MSASRFATVSMLSKHVQQLLHQCFNQKTLASAELVVENIMSNHWDPHNKDVPASRFDIQVLISQDLSFRCQFIFDPLELNFPPDIILSDNLPLVLEDIHSLVNWNATDKNALSDLVNELIEKFLTLQADQVRLLGIQRIQIQADMLANRQFYSFVKLREEPLVVVQFIVPLFTIENGIKTPLFNLTVDYSVNTRTDSIHVDVSTNEPSDAPGKPFRLPEFRAASESIGLYCESIEKRASRKNGEVSDRFTSRRNLITTISQRMAAHILEFDEKNFTYLAYKLRIVKDPEYTTESSYRIRRRTFLFIVNVKVHQNFPSENYPPTVFVICLNTKSTVPLRFRYDPYMTPEETALMIM